MSENNIVVVKGLEKKYKSGTHAVKGINFEVKKGEIFGMLGPNGAGKTTTLQMMGTLLNITNGKNFKTILGTKILVSINGFKKLTSLFLKNSTSSNKFKIIPKL